MILKEIETWPSKKFYYRINNTIFNRNFIVIKLTYLTIKAKLLSSNYCKGGTVYLYPSVLLRFADSKFIDYFGYYSRLYYLLEIKVLYTAAAKNFYSIVAFFIDKGVDI